MKNVEVRVKAFETAVAEVLEIMGFKVETDVLLSSHQLDLYAEYFAGISHFRLAVECKEMASPVGAADVQRFASAATLLRNRGLIDKGIIVSNGGFSAGAKSAAQQYGIQCVTLRELEAHLIDFSPYLHAVIQRFESSDLAQTFIEPSLRDSVGVIHPAIRYLSGRAVSGKELRVCILGGFGMGKSTLCNALAAELSRKSMMEPESTPIPILLSLHEYSKTSGLRELITDALVTQHGVHLSSFDAFTRLAMAARLVLIMDGFDEMSTSSDRPTMMRNLLEISQIVGRRGKLILTSRPEYFGSDNEARALLGSNELEFGFSERPRFEIMQLMDWNEKQIDSYLERAAGQNARAIRETIQTTYNLHDLASRPVLLAMIARTGPLLSASHQGVNKAVLYKAFVDTFLEREAIQSAGIDPIQLRAAIQDLAWKMYTEKVTAMRPSEAAEVLSTWLQRGQTAEPFVSAPPTGMGTFLTRDSYGNVQFIHKSFMEYFVAEKVATRGIEKLDDGAPAVEVQSFLAEMRNAKISFGN